jgi:hypothetical protein
VILVKLQIVIREEALTSGSKSRFLLLPDLTNRENIASRKYKGFGGPFFHFLLCFPF